MLRTSTSPGPGSGMAVSTSVKSLGLGAPAGRAARRIWRLTALGIGASPLDGSGHAAVEVDGGAGDVGGAIGDEEGDEIAELGGMRHAAQRDALGQLAIVGLEVAVLGAPVDLGAADEADTDGVHEDLVRRVLVGERLGEVDAGRAG